MSSRIPFLLHLHVRLVGYLESFIPVDEDRVEQCYRVQCDDDTRMQGIVPENGPWMHGLLDSQLSELVHRGAFLVVQTSVRLR